MYKTNKNKKGSVLVFSLFLMMISLIIGISMMATSVTTRRSSLSSSKSVYSFQIANDGIEDAFFAIKEGKESFPIINTLTIDQIFPTCDVATNVVVKSYGSDNYTLTFMGYDPPIIPLPTPPPTPPAPIKLECGDLVGGITSIKSVGTYRNVSRAVESSVDLTAI